MQANVWLGPVPPLQDFGVRSGTSHLLQALKPTPSETASNTAQILRMPISPPPGDYTGNPCRPRGERCSGRLSRQPGLAGEGEHDKGRFHGAAILQAHQAVTDRVLPYRQARTGAPPGVHGLAIGARTVGDPGKELQGEGGGSGGRSFHDRHPTGKRTILLNIRHVSPSRKTNRPRRLAPGGHTKTRLAPLSAV